MDVGTLIMKINADTKNIESGLEKTKKSIGTFGKAAAKGMAIAGTAAIGAGAAMLKMSEKAAESTDRIDKMSQKLGLSRKGFQELEFAISQNGGSIDSLGAGMKTLINQTDELAKGGKVAEDAFGELGIAYEDLEGLSQEEIFEKTITALQGMEDETKRAAIANDLLGRSGQELAPLLNAGADSLEAMKKQANDLGLVMGDDAIDAGVKFTDSMDQVKRMVGVAGASIGVGLMPIIQKFLEWVISNMPVIKNVMSTVFGVISAVVKTTTDIFKNFLIPIFKVVYEYVQANMPVIKETMKTVFDTIVTVATNVYNFYKDNILPIFKVVVGYVMESFPVMQKTVENVFSGVVVAVQAAWDIFKWLFEFVKPTFPLIGSIISTAFGVVNDVVNGVIDTFKILVDWITKAVEAVSKFSKSDASKSTSQYLKQYTGNSYGGMDKQRAFGGPVTAGKSYLVGETGQAEVFTPSENGTVSPISSSSGGTNISNNFNVATLVVREEADITKIARELFNMQRDNERGLGLAI